MRRSILFAASAAILVMGSIAQAATIYVESRSGGQNFASYSQAGTWSTSTSKSTAAGVTPGIGSTFSSNAFTDRSFTAAPSLPLAGTYQVALTAAGNMNANQPVAITHASGTANITPDLSTGVANAWKVLGSWDFNSGAGTSLKLSSSGVGTAVIRGDAVRFTLIPAVLSADVDGNAIADNGLVDFGTQVQSSLSQQVLTITNTGAGSLVLGAASIGGGFSISSGGAAITLATGGSTSMTIDMDTSNIGPVACLISFSSNIEGNTDFQLDLTGNVEAAVPEPSTVALLSLAAFSLAGVFRRR